MDRILAAEVFVATVEQGSITAAATALNMSRSMASRYLSEMESWAGNRLLHRSTRKISLTSTGEDVLSDCRQLLAIANNLPDQHTTEDLPPKGNLRISCSQFLAQSILPTILQRFLRDYPHICIDIHISNDAVNLVEQRIDLAIRITNALDPNLIARPLGKCSSVLCATSSYLESAGVPQTPQQLIDHNCLTYSYFGNSLWHFHDQQSDNQQSSEMTVPVSGNLSANESMTLMESTLLGMGISHQPKFVATPYLQSGQLQQVLVDYTLEQMNISGIYQSRKNQPRPLRLLLDHLVEEFAVLDL
ncbi:LysR family transcriptional regulator [Aliamphritea ceti]|uniref:LysR family transcriptional regulator n=1 Tax=Aliamphritea ceti TaxID=1524258 RepID=UPI0021C48024|nr:LysR family transcriptional regulator [Aliamphritea ceti]